MTDANSLAARNIIFFWEVCNVNPHSPTPAVGPVKINWEKKKKTEHTRIGEKKITSEKEKNRRRRKRGFTQDFRHTEGEGGRNEQQKKKTSFKRKKIKPKITQSWRLWFPSPGDFLRSG